MCVIKAIKCLWYIHHNYITSRAIEKSWSCPCCLLLNRHGNGTSLHSKGNTSSNGSCSNRVSLLSGWWFQRNTKTTCLNFDEFIPKFMSSKTPRKPLSSAMAIHSSTSRMRVEDKTTWTRWNLGFVESNPWRWRFQFKPGKKGLEIYKFLCYPENPWYPCVFIYIWQISIVLSNKYTSPMDLCLV